MFSPAPVLSILVLGFAGSGIAYLLYYHLLAHISATQVAAVTYLLPFWGIFWGLVSHETIPPLAYAGVVVVIAGLVLMNRSGRHYDLRTKQQRDISRRLLSGDVGAKLG
jgi:drug/metabolite transporter (DMT)-like permease